MSMGTGTYTHMSKINRKFTYKLERSCLRILFGYKGTWYLFCCTQCSSFQMIEKRLRPSQNYLSVYDIVAQQNLSTCELLYYTMCRSEEEKIKSHKQFGIPCLSSC